MTEGRSERTEKTTQLQEGAKISMEWGTMKGNQRDRLCGGTYRSRLSVIRVTLREQSTPEGLNQWNMRTARVRAPPYAATVTPDGL